MTRICFILAFLLAASASAAEKPDKKPPVNKIYKKTELHRFSGQTLRGQIKKPDLSYIYQRKGLRAEQIVGIPENFDNEIARGVEKF
ncbi:MAG: hypothetical protein A2583_05480 [Bdellovibrionales bacterium RIFOXYD1_FULL_53_11]|nr:MAG: hypothetical protein A2583_05480 [Bdellovibrionales bacterium RIFOXYD1_FULL_53_11]